MAKLEARHREETESFRLQLAAVPKDCASTCSPTSDTSSQLAVLKQQLENEAAARQQVEAAVRDAKVEQEARVSELTLELDLQTAALVEARQQAAALAETQQVKTAAS